MKKIAAISFLPFLLLIIIIPSLVITSRPSISYSNQSSFYSSLSSDKEIIYSFSSSDPNLDSLTFTLKNPQILNNSLIYFSVSNSSEERTLSFSGSNIGDPSNLKLKFLPLPNHSGTYTIRITNNNITPESLFILTDFNKKPIFSGTYYQSDLSNRIKFNTQKLITQITSFKLYYSLPYLMVLILIFVKL